MGSQVLPENLLRHGLFSMGTIPVRNLLWRRVSMGCIFLQGISICCCAGSFTGCSVVICSNVFLSMGYMKTTYFAVVFNMAAKEIVFQSHASSLTVMSARLFQISILFLFLTAVVQCFLPFLKYVFWEELEPWLRGSTVSHPGSAGAIWNQLCLAWDKPWQFLTETTPVAPHTHPPPPDKTVLSEYNTVVCLLRKHSDISWQYKSNNIVSFLISIAVKYLCYFPYYPPPCSGCFLATNKVRKIHHFPWRDVNSSEQFWKVLLISLSDLNTLIMVALNVTVPFW